MFVSFWDHFGIMSGSFGIILGSYWDRVGIIWDHFGITVYDHGRSVPSEPPPVNQLAVVGVPMWGSHVGSPCRVPHVGSLCRVPMPGPHVGSLAGRGGGRKFSLSKNEETTQ